VFLFLFFFQIKIETISRKSYSSCSKTDHIIGLEQQVGFSDNIDDILVIYNRQTERERERERVAVETETSLN
jgi:hypothetical protein